MTTEIHDHIHYDTAEEYYVLNSDTGVEECNGPFTEWQAYERTKTCRTPWKVLKFHDEGKGTLS